jgi:site-specific recombinase XerC
MHKGGYAPQTRRDAIGAVQTYLSWLFEGGLLANDPEPIIRNFQRPRLPDYLPRNLPPDADRLVQELLEERGGVVALALLLMRRTGIRIGDLMALPFDCLREDPDGSAYMKVPIGKLHNERFVPLDSATLSILKRVMKLSLKNNHGRKPELLAIRPDGKPGAKNDYYLGSTRSYPWARNLWSRTDCVTHMQRRCSALASASKRSRSCSATAHSRCRCVTPR